VGYYEGRRVRATFAKGKLQVNRALEKKVAPLTSDDCRWVFDHLKLCAEADPRPSCNGSFDEISQEWAMMSLRSLKMMEHNPRSQTHSMMLSRTSKPSRARSLRGAHPKQISNFASTLGCRHPWTAPSQS